MFYQELFFTSDNKHLNKQDSGLTFCYNKREEAGTKILKA
jgi:hypothetical protein